MNWFLSEKALLIFILIASIALYFPTNKRKSRYSFKSRLDDLIPLIPEFIIPYSLMYFFLVFSIVTTYSYSDIYFKLLTALIICTLSAALFWYFVPNGVIRSNLPAKAVFSKFINILYAHDKDSNGFPSGHVYLAIIPAYYLSVWAPEYTLWFIIIGGSISISTVFVKQHYVADILGGLVWSAGAIAITQFLLR